MTAKQFGASTVALAVCGFLAASVAQATEAGVEIESSQPGAQVETNVQVETESKPLAGQLMIKDPTLRTFSIQGFEEVYVAPETLDLEKYRGEDVTVTFDEYGKVKSIDIDRQG